MITEEEYDAFLADDSQTVLNLYRAESDEAYTDAPSKAKTVSYVKTVRVNPEINSETYFNTDR